MCKALYKNLTLLLNDHDKSSVTDANTNRLQEVLLPLVPMNDCRAFYADHDVTPVYHQQQHPIWDDSASSLSTLHEDMNYDIDDESMLYNTSLVGGSMICAGGYPEGGVGACLVSGARLTKKISKMSLKYGKNLKHVKLLHIFRNVCKKETEIAI